LLVVVVIERCSEGNTDVVLKGKSTVSMKHPMAGKVRETVMTFHASAEESVVRKAEEPQSALHDA
jgi:hypothetical protein